MGGGEQLSEFLRGTIVGCHMCNKSIREISTMLNLPRSTVVSVLLRWKREGSTVALPRSGRPHKLAEEGRQVLQGKAMESGRALPGEFQTASGAKMDITAVERGNRLSCTMASPSVFGCPLCPRFSTKSQSVIQRHLLNHGAKAVHYNGQKHVGPGKSEADASHQAPRTVSELGQHIPADQMQSHLAVLLCNLKPAASCLEL
ncbi:uncharacterized protein isoform X5 [Takifugu rubripes]|uniref:uncharacterized protein isoform X5 n=1 Tax=Takifugu rubripes TaxID=31033 RepID=UPI0005D167C1|nr:uncharacterized protein LOC105417696 isoform X5 [Takifugu rubripes]|eukprot:XP_011611241.1 PREDICTED: uncharacterized protein LOC105417696 isoform X4 [Takifugu rubripes]